MKRFSVTGVTRDKDYDLTPGKSNTMVHYFTANPNFGIHREFIYSRGQGKCNVAMDLRHDWIQSGYSIDFYRVLVASWFPIDQCERLDAVSNEGIRVFS